MCGVARRTGLNRSMHVGMGMGRAGWSAPSYMGRILRLYTEARKDVNL